MSNTKSLAVRTATEALERLRALEARLSSLSSDRELRSIRVDIAHIEHMLDEHAALMRALPDHMKPLYGPHECRRCAGDGRQWSQRSDGSEVDSLCDECNGTTQCLRDVCGPCRDAGADRLSENGTAASSTHSL